MSRPQNKTTTKWLAYQDPQTGAQPPMAVTWSHLGPGTTPGFNQVEAQVEETPYAFELFTKPFPLGTPNTVGGEGWVIHPTTGQKQPFWWILSGTALSLWQAGHVFTFECPLPQAQRRRGETDEALEGVYRCVAPMPGTVLQCSLAEGQAVEKGQPLVVMESMKMELTVSAPSAGLVKAVHCQAGQLVDRGAVLIELESAG